MIRRRAMRRVLGVAGALAFAFAVAVVGVAGPAGAHSDTGTLGIEVTPAPTPSVPFTAKVRVLLEYANDREVAPGATVVATASGPDGASAGPTPLADKGQGSYEALLALPSAGSWTVTVTATNPTATATAAIVLAPSSATVPGATTPATPPTGIDTSSDRVNRDEAPASDDGGGDDGTSPLLLAVIAIAVVAVVAGAVTLVRRR